MCWGPPLWSTRELRYLTLADYVWSQRTRPRWLSFLHKYAVDTLTGLGPLDKYDYLGDTVEAGRAGPLGRGVPAVCQVIAHGRPMRRGPWL